MEQNLVQDKTYGIEMKQKVVQALSKAFIGSEVELDPESLLDGRYTGLIIWAGFDGLDSIDRHRKVKQALITALGNEAANVGILFTYTPVEMQAMSAA